MESISIHPPLEGEWRFSRPPGHHPYAFDFVQMNAKAKSPHSESRFRFFVGRIPSSSFYCWNKPVFAPVDGEVIRVENGWEDHKYTNIWRTIQIWYNATYRFRPKEKDGRLDIRPNAGNHVMIQAEEGYVVFLAHLKIQSIVVTEGSQVRQGEIVGMVGNSGNSTMPHLHINLFDQMDDPFSAQVLPFVFSSYQMMGKDGRWIAMRSSLPKPGTFVSFQ